MSRPTFEPIGFAKHLASTEDYRIANDQCFQWTGSYWVPMSNREYEREALEWIETGDYGIANSTNAKQACATAMLRLPELREPVRLAVIPVLNGYVHVDGTGVTLKHHDKELGLRHIIKCEYNPAATAPVAFDKFLCQVLPDRAVRERVQEYIGYTLLPDAPHQIAQFWLGLGANGKGVLANIVQALHHRVAAVNLDDLDGFSMTEVVNASLIYCDEAPQQRINDRTFKMVTAAETVTIKRKYRDPISTRVLGKWLILGNHLPEITDHSEGFWRRMDIVPFDVTIPKEDRNPMLARHIIEHELGGVLNWALEGAVRLLARGCFDPIAPRAMRQALESAKTESNTVLEWWEDIELKVKTTTDTLKMDVYRSYSNWCKSNGLTSVPMPKFWKRLTNSVKGVIESRMTTKSGRPRVCNIALQPY
jgi:putative DNA primase/helicase